MQNERSASEACTLNTGLYGRETTMLPANQDSVSACHILVVDDQALIATGLRALFESRGMQVSTARNGLEAMELLSTTPFAAVVTDFNMPQCNGAELIAEIRRQDGEQLPIILLTADRQATDRLKGTNNLQVLHKPARIDQLLSAMEQALQKTLN